ncbi:molybdenum cofactor guanylyltransferase [bacterium]|nr:molybdenum cofactor guanylyltransferase [bacterium]
MAQCVGLVLAGGAGRRLGRTKGDLVLPRAAGVSLAERAARCLDPACSRVLISIAPGAADPAQGWDVLEDPVAGNGPLAGIDTALTATESSDLLVLACDYPRVDTTLLRRMLSIAEEAAEDLVMLTDPAGRDHPLVAVWKRSTQTVVREAVEQGRFRVRSLLPDLAVRRLGPLMLPGVDLGRALLNVNWPDDLRKLD